MTVLRVDPDSYVPPFEQLREQITEQVTHGRLAPGHRLPPVRRLAADLGLAPNTVARAYRELEAAGVVNGRGSRGTFVVGPPTSDADAPEPGESEDVRAAAARFARRAVGSGIDADRALELVRSALADLVPDPGDQAGRTSSATG